MGGILRNVTSFLRALQPQFCIPRQRRKSDPFDITPQGSAESLNSRIRCASKIAPMKNKLAAAALAILFVSTGATAMAHERCREDSGYSGYSRYRDAEIVRYAEPQVYIDRYGNRTIVTREQRYAVPMADHYRRPVVVPQCRPAPVCEPRYESRSHREPHLVGALRFIFGR